MILFSYFVNILYLFLCVVTQKPVFAVMEILKFYSLIFQSSSTRCYAGVKREKIAQQPKNNKKNYWTYDCTVFGFWFKNKLFRIKLNELNGQQHNCNIHQSLKKNKNKNKQTYSCWNFCELRFPVRNEIKIQFFFLLK